MSSRSSRRPSPSLSAVEALLLAQATWELGAAPKSWPLVARLLSRHPLLSRPKNFFTAQSCQSMYETILKEAGLDISEANNVPQADANLNLARKHYRLRIEELRASILAEESKFKTVLREIEEIRAGLWDTKIYDGARDQSPIQQASAGIGDFERILALPSQTQENSQRASDIDPARTEMLSNENSREMSSSVRSNSQAPDNEDDVSLTESSQLAKERDGEHVDQRQEEEEEELEEIKEEEEEAASQARDELEHEDEVIPSARLGAETDSEQEPVVLARRSSRRRRPSMMSGPQPFTRPGLRPRARVSESELQAADSDNEAKEILPGADDEQMSPFDSGIAKLRDGAQVPSSSIRDISVGKRKSSFLDGDSPQDRKRMRGDSEPAEEEELGISSHNTRARTTRNALKTEEQVALRRFQNVIGMLHSQISQHRNGTIFHNPIKPSEAPDYHEIVKRPLDLKTIKARVKDGVISNSLEFQRDIYLMFANAIMYNRPGSDVHVMAENMMLESEAQINTFRQTEGLVRRGQRP